MKQAKNHSLAGLILALSLAGCGGGQDHLSTGEADKSEVSASTQNDSASTTVPPQVSQEESSAWARSAAINRAEVQQFKVSTSPEASANLGPTAISATTSPMYRFFNYKTGAHLLTLSVTERDTVLNKSPDFRYEGPVFAAWRTASAGLSPVYRFYNLHSGTHFYTISDTEKNNILATAPWMLFEGGAYYASKTAQAGTTPLYRFYHQQLGIHFYTANESEKNYIDANLKSTYRLEGVAYYVNASIGTYDKALAPFAGKVNSFGNVNGIGDSARFGNIRGMHFSPTGDLYVVDRGGKGDWFDSAEIKKITSSGLVTSFAGSWNTRYDHANGTGSGIAFTGLDSLTFDSNGILYFGDLRTVRTISKTATSATIAGSLDDTGYLDGQAQAARFLGVRGIARDSSGNIYVSECFTAATYPSARIRKITPTGVVSTFAGQSGTPYNTNSRGFADGQGINARFDCPGHMDIDNNNNLYVADTGNHRIRKITPDGMVTTLAGQSSYGVVDGVGTAAKFDLPFALAVDKSTGNIYTADWDGYTVRKITPSGTVTTIVGTPYTRGVFFGSLPAGLAEISGLAVRDGRLYIASLNGIYWTHLP